MKTGRRKFLGSLAGLLGLGLLGQPAKLLAGDLPRGKRHFACNVYAWVTFFRRQGRDWSANLDAGLREFAESGLKGFEPSVTSAAELETIIPLLKKYGLQMRSIYVGSRLHERGEAEKSAAEVLAIAAAAGKAGVEIVVTNPSPIGGGVDKSDSQLELQAANLNRLGAALRGQGLVLAYHNHDPEMRRSAREFHHMMLATDPANLKLCLDAHWVYRGAGDSQVALFDIVRLYGRRIAEVHLRQSRDGVWTETFGDGDIDYSRLAVELLRLGVRPHLVLEQAVEKRTPNTMGPVEAHRQSLQYAARVFAKLMD